jgi:tetratricopeptide (TPR) repeat protein
MENSNAKEIKLVKRRNPLNPIHFLWIGPVVGFVITSIIAILNWKWLDEGKVAKRTFVYFILAVIVILMIEIFMSLEDILFRNLFLICNLLVGVLFMRLQRKIFAVYLETHRQDAIFSVTSKERFIRILKGVLCGSLIGTALGVGLKDTLSFWLYNTRNSYFVLGPIPGLFLGLTIGAVLSGIKKSSSSSWDNIKGAINAIIGTVVAIFYACIVFGTIVEVFWFETLDRPWPDFLPSPEVLFILFWYLLGLLGGLIGGLIGIHSKRIGTLFARNIIVLIVGIVIFLNLGLYLGARPYLYYNVSMFLCEHQKWNWALLGFNKAREVKCDFVDAHKAVAHYIYENRGMFFEALKEYRKALMLNPNDEGVKKDIKRIESSLVGEIRGRVLLKNRKDHRGITISIFDGFMTSHTITDENGFFEIPIFKVTKGTIVFVFMSKDGYFPEIRSIVITTSQTYDSIPERKTYEVSQVILNPIKKNQTGVIIGVCYTVISGGKLVPHYGISSTKANMAIKAKSGKLQYSTTSFLDGSYKIVVPKGDYEVYWGEGNFNRARKIKVKRGKTYILNIPLGRILVD